MMRMLWIGGLLAYLLLRIMLATQPTYLVDVQMYAHWSLKAATKGLPDVYRTSGMDYPPLYAYILYPLGKLYLRLVPDGTWIITESRLLTFLIKLPPLLFDLGIAWLLAAIARRRGAGDRWQRALLALYLGNPAVVFSTGYWGHPDSVFCFLVLAALVVLGSARRRSNSTLLSGALLALALLTKPLAAPYIPLLAGLGVVWHGVRRTLLGIAAALGTGVLACLPFILREGAATFIQHMGDNLRVMPFTTCNAHNIWWLIAPWQLAGEVWHWPLTLTQLGLGLVCLYLAALAVLALRTHHRAPGGLAAEHGIALAAGTAFAFFMLATRLHENHMFPVAVFLTALLPWPAPHAAGAQRAALVLLAAASLGSLLNMALHDPALSALWPRATAALTPVEVLVGGELFFGPPGATRWAAGLNLATFLTLTAWIFLPRGRGLLDRLAPAPRGSRAREAR